MVLRAALLGNSVLNGSAVFQVRRPYADLRRIPWKAILEFWKDLEEKRGGSYFPGRHEPWMAAIRSANGLGVRKANSRVLSPHGCVLPASRENDFSLASHDRPCSNSLRALAPKAANALP